MKKKRNRKSQITKTHWAYWTHRPIAITACGKRLPVEAIVDKLEDLTCIVCRRAIGQEVK